MIYHRVKDYMIKRCEEETAARERVRANVVTNYYTAFLQNGDTSGLTYGSIKRWFDGGYLSWFNVKLLWEKGVLTEEEYREITHRYMVELPIEDYANLDNQGRPIPVIAEVTIL